MRVLQNVGIYPSYARRIAILTAGQRGFDALMETFRHDRFDGVHLLKPVIDRSDKAFLAVGNFEAGQQAWAVENGLKAKTRPADILLAQLEAHRAEVFYNLDPVRFDDQMLRRLPGCVKRTLAWSAAPTPHNRFSGYDLVVNNFPAILARYAELGCKTAPFFPALDPEMQAYSANCDRPIDILFVGGYSRHHVRRASILDAVARLAPGVKVRYHLDLGRLTKIAELPFLSRIGSLASHRRSPEVRAIAAPPIFGRDLYRALGDAKIVLNAAIDMAGNERGNMRCFETLGCGALLMSDSGTYPDGMVPAETLCTYDDADNAVAQIMRLLDDQETCTRIAATGQQMLAKRYSKDAQWAAFQALVAGIPSKADALAPA